MTTALLELLFNELPDLHGARREDLAAKIKALVEDGNRRADVITFHCGGCRKCTGRGRK